MNPVEKEILLLPNMDGNERIFLHNVLGELSEDDQLTAMQMYRVKRKDPQIMLLLVLLGLVGVLDGARADWVPDDDAVLAWEGWVLGQTALPRA